VQVGRVGVAAAYGLPLLTVCVCVCAISCWLC